MAHLRRLLHCCVALVAAKRRSPSERTPERARAAACPSPRDADPERYYNASWTPGPPRAWNSTRRLTSTNLIDPAAHAATSLPRPPADRAGRHWAGMVDSDDRTGGRLFYWLFEKKESGPAPVIIWLNGGPGCSSMDGLFLELGPLKLAPRGATPALRTRGESWHRAAHALFVDQPVGTGFSRTSPRGYCKNDQCIVDQFETFPRGSPELPHLLKDAATCRPLLASHRHYIPLMVQNCCMTRPREQLEALGNAWVHPGTSTTHREQLRLSIISDQEASRIVAGEVLPGETLEGHACSGVLICRRRHVSPGREPGASSGSEPVRRPGRRAFQSFFPPDQKGKRT